MGLPELRRIMSLQRRRRQPQSPRDGSVDASPRPRANREADSRCQAHHVPAGGGSEADAGDQANTEADSRCGQPDDASHTQAGQTEGPNFPEEIWRHIHSLMPLRDAARAACVSQSFLWSWRHHPNLILSRETLGLDVHAYEETASDFKRRIDHILRNHSGTGVRKLILWSVPNYGAKDRDNVDKWLEKAVTQGIEELTLTLPMSNHRKYKFPCKLLSNGLGDSLRCLYLCNCSFHPAAGLCCLRSLTKLELLMVRITGDEVCCLLSSSSALQQVILRDCSKVNCLKIPCHLQRLSHVKVEDCSKLRVIESKAPNLSSFHFVGNNLDLEVQVSLGEALQVKNLRMNSTEFGCYTQAELASNMPSREMVNSPMGSSKLANLNSVGISLGEIPFARSFDCSSLASIFGASLTLEAFISHVSNELMQHVLTFGDPLWMLGNKGVWSPKNKRLVQLACHMLRAWLS